jgi:hypothetical protein
MRSPIIDEIEEAVFRIKSLGKRKNGQSQFVVLSKKSLGKGRGEKLGSHSGPFSEKGNLH